MIKCSFRFLLIFSFLIIINSCNSSKENDKDKLKYVIDGKWASTEATTIAISGTDIYIAGQINLVTEFRCIDDADFDYSEYKFYTGYWINGKWINLTVPGQNEFPYSDPTVSSIVVSGDDVYVGVYYYGDRGNAQSNIIAGFWKNGVWTTLSSEYSAMISSITVSGSIIYALEHNYRLHYYYFKNGFWKNSTWIALSPDEGSASSLIVSGSDVYICGSVDSESLGNYTKYSYNEIRAVYWKNEVLNVLPLPAFAEEFLNSEE